MHSNSGKQMTINDPSSSFSTGLMFLSRTYPWVFWQQRPHGLLTDEFTHSHIMQGSYRIACSNSQAWRPIFPNHVSSWILVSYQPCTATRGWLFYELSLLLSYAHNLNILEHSDLNHSGSGFNLNNSFLKINIHRLASQFFFAPNTHSADEIICCCSSSWNDPTFQKALYPSFPKSPIPQSHLALKKEPLFPQIF